jgi:alpha-galactosidase
MAKNRAADGMLVGDSQKFPHGMAWMGEQIGGLGLKFGITRMRE